MNKYEDRHDSDRRVAQACEAIHALLAAYGERMDAGDFAAVGQLFARATLRNGNDPTRVVASGADEVAGLLTETIRTYDGIPREHHLTTNTIVEVDLDAGVAQARSVYVVFMEAPGFALQPTGAGRYHDQFTLTDDEWCFADRLFLQDLVGDGSAHARRSDA